MNRIPPFPGPLFLGFDTMEKTLKLIAKANDGYPPYNIERIASGADETDPERLRVTLAIAGFNEEELEIVVEEQHLFVRGRQAEQPHKEYLYRGIASRQFQRVFALADGMQVLGANLRNGLLSIDIVRPLPGRVVRKINISVSQ